MKKGRKSSNFSLKKLPPAEAEVLALRVENLALQQQAKASTVKEAGTLVEERTAGESSGSENKAPDLMAAKNAAENKAAQASIGKMVRNILLQAENKQIESENTVAQKASVAELKELDVLRVVDTTAPPGAEIVAANSAATAQGKSAAKLSASESEAERLNAKTTEELSTSETAAPDTKAATNAGEQAADHKLQVRQLSRAERLAKLRSALLKAHKDSRVDSQSTENNAPTPKDKKAETFVLPATPLEKYQLAIKVQAISARKVRHLKYKRTRYTAKDLRMSIFDMLAISRNYLTAERQLRRRELQRQFASLSDEELIAARQAFVAKQAAQAAKNEPAKLPANKRRQARLRAQKIAGFRKLEQFFKRYKVTEEKTVLQRKLNNFSKLFRNVRIGFAFVILIIGICLTLVALLPQFYLQNISVKGNERISAAEIANFFDLEKQKGRHLLTFVNGNAAECLQLRDKQLELRLQDNYPMIASVTCRVKFPNELEISIKETTEIAYIKIPGGYANIDAEGRILSLNMGEPSDYVPLIKGLDVSRMEINEKFSAIDSKSFNNAIMFMDGLMRSDADSNDNLQMILALKSINLMPDFSLWLEFNFGKDALAVHINADVNNYPDLIYWLRNTKLVGALDNLGSGYLDLTGKQKVFVSAANNEQLAEEAENQLKSQVWDESEWTWKNIVVKSYDNKVGD